MPEVVVYIVEGRTLEQKPALIHAARAAWMPLKFSWVQRTIFLLRCGKG
ncbi:MAG: hypothetical protein ABSC37_08235 [Xanthobacteraceae bacterium]|jgi:hypothetical protein